MLFTLLISLNMCMVELRRTLGIQAHHDACFALHSPKIHVQIKGAYVCPALGIKETTDTNLRSLNAIFSSVSQRKAWFPSRPGKPEIARKIATSLAIVVFISCKRYLSMGASHNIK